MRTTDHVLDLVAGKQAYASRAAGVIGVMTAAWRLFRSRCQIARLNELDDRQLLDMGLRREDVHEAITSPFFDNPASYLTRASRNRVSLFYKGIRHD
ncbi:MULTISPECIES: DUF1127 domain-containing protein [Ensifer]|jgi:uncharacterized protein YjiS (DUF1127 family)|uniref:DUF1127 domain-containing protein n=1 Tax=Ensifer canadensis TaxID=555315 RepID=A0AAW4FKD7_9HYPH|nr:MULTISPECIES: DUF1127 domain-containing protein [Ensifer]MDP9628298.1 uncharacterized protein YjiS (DUF1127 family) [Ensifer adhaerens]KQU71712.1 hypothetical protein ASD00_16570 [Ensifer sp. Root31]KQW62660.1 hypothetical protein ASD02_00565 [Ensifer sp. Root1252]KQY71505.1 hypothetical protein ASD52_07530 [Ensifer sp. Root142]KRC83480.1 hypothetical protein ASE32_00560 [Ensifer sp. Root231]